jgi:hypothetical protein
MEAHEAFRIYTLQELEARAGELMEASANDRTDLELAVRCLIEVRLISAEIRYRTENSIWVHAAAAEA